MSKRICVSPLHLCLLALVALACDPVSARDTERYATVYGYGLDKWATAWLLTRKVVPESRLVVAGSSDELPADAAAFDVPGADYVRTGSSSAFASALKAHDGASSVMRRLSRVVHQIEVAYWQADSTPETLSVEHAFRRLQRGNRRVPATCYLRFFDSVVAAMRTTDAGEPLPDDRLLDDCGSELSVADAERGESRGPVSEVPLGDVLTALREGREVLFVDVREPEEFAESRIPGAINVPIRSLDDDVVARAADADLVISYCVKDFRGFEMAKLFWRAGVQRSAIIKPYGLKGWISAGLPVAGTEAMPEDRAVAALRDCLARGSCLETGQ